MDKPISNNRIHKLPFKTKLEARRDILHKLNHDVRTPIGRIIELANLLIENDKEEIEVRSADLKMIKVSAESIIDIIDSVLAENVHDKNETAKENHLPR